MSRSTNNPNLPLTEHQRKILTLVALDNQSKEIADKLGMRQNSVWAHMTMIRDKIKAKGRAGMALWASRNGLVKFDGKGWTALMLLVSICVAQGFDVIPLPAGATKKPAKLASPKGAEQLSLAGRAMAIAPAPFYRTTKLAWNPYRSDLTNSVVFDLWGSNDLKTVRTTPISNSIPGSATSVTYTTTNQSMFFFALSVRLKP